MARAFCPECAGEVPVGEDGRCFLGHQVHEPEVGGESVDASAVGSDDAVDVHGGPADEAPPADTMPVSDTGVNDAPTADAPTADDEDAEELDDDFDLGSLELAVAELGLDLEDEDHEPEEDLFQRFEGEEDAAEERVRGPEGQDWEVREWPATDETVEASEAEEAFEAEGAGESGAVKPGGHEPLEQDDEQATPVDEGQAFDALEDEPVPLGPEEADESDEPEAVALEEDETREQEEPEPVTLEDDEEGVGTDVGDAALAQAAAAAVAAMNEEAASSSLDEGELDTTPAEETEVETPPEPPHAEVGEAGTEPEDLEDETPEYASAAAVDPAAPPETADDTVTAPDLADDEQPEWATDEIETRPAASDIEETTPVAAHVPDEDATGVETGDRPAEDDGAIPGADTDLDDVYGIADTGEEDREEDAGPDTGDEPDIDLDRFTARPKSRTGLLRRLFG